MHDIRAIRENPTAFDAALARRGLAPLSSSLLAIDEARRAGILAAETATAEGGDFIGLGDSLWSAPEGVTARLSAIVKALETSP